MNLVGDRVDKKEIDTASQVNLVEYLHSKGEPIIKTGNAYYKHQEHDSLVINSDGRWYWNSRSIGGKGAISFAREFYNYSFQNAVRDVNNQEITHSISVETNQKNTNSATFKYPKYFEVEHINNITNYLVHERGIDEKVVLALQKHNLIAEDQKKNVVFKWRDNDGHIIGADRQGTIKMDNKRGSFKQIVAGSDLKNGFRIDIGQPKKIAFFESPIDAISYYDLKRPTDIRLVSMSGLREESVHVGIHQLSLQMQKNGIDFKEFQGIIIATDNDQAGNDFAEKVAAIYEDVVREKSMLKDWNDDLKEERFSSKNNSVSKNLSIEIER